MNSLILLILAILNIYTWVVIATVILSWLFAFNVINYNNQFVRQLHYVLNRLTEPLLGPIRRFLPDLGGIDISPVVLLLALFFLKNLVIEYGTRLVG
ncbi:MAG TPA: YggT family protein [Rhizobiales bacterium]|nr:YggT family protein [Hyphomicrobiales bacterium]